MATLPLVFGKLWEKNIEGFDLERKPKKEKKTALS